LNYPLQIVKYLEIGYPKYPDVFLILQPIFSICVPIGFYRVDISIHLNRQSGFHAIEIEDEFSQGRLPTKMMTQGIPPQARPQEPFCRCHYPAEVLGELNCGTGCLAAGLSSYIHRIPLNIPPPLSSPVCRFLANGGGFHAVVLIL
jgi:hypothetical protein